MHQIPIQLANRSAHLGVSRSAAVDSREQPEVADSGLTGAHLARYVPCNASVTGQGKPLTQLDQPPHHISEYEEACVVPVMDIWHVLAWNLRNASSHKLIYRQTLTEWSPLLKVR